MVDYPNIFGQGMDAFAQGYDTTQKITQDRARTLAGRAISQGDYQTAASVLGNVGLKDEAQNAILQGQSQQSRKAEISAGTALAGGDYSGAAKALGGAGLVDQAQRAVISGQDQQNRQGRISAATAYGNGDYAGAIKALGPTGDLKSVADVQDQIRSQHKDQLTYVSQEAAKLQQIYKQAGPAAMLQAFDANVANYKSMGSDDQSLAQIRQGLQQDPETTLSRLIQPKHSFHVVGDTMMVTDDNTGAVIGSYTGKKFMPVGADQSLWEVGGDGAQPSTAQAASAPRSVRNNNPLNLTTLPQGQWDGQTGADGRFAVFASPEAGMAAADKNLQAYATQHGINTVQGIVNRWAPKGDGANDPQAYAETVAKDIGVKPDQPLDLTNPQTRAMVLHSMAKVERGGPSNATPAASPGAAPAGARLVAQGPVAEAAKAMSESAGGGLTGDAYLQTLPPQIQGTVKAIAEGRMPLPSGFVLKTPYGQQLISAVSQYDPTFSSANAATRVATRKDFTSGKSAQTLTAFNTALAHLSNLDQAISDLNNNGFPLNNQVAHLIAGATGTDQRLTNFELTKRTALDEVNKALVGSGGALGDREALMTQLNAAKSPESLHQAVRSLADLLQGKINAMGQQYQQGMGTDAYPIQLVTPEAKKTLDRLDGTGGAKVAAKPQQSADGIPTVSPEQAAKLSRGTRFRTTDGRVLVRQ